MQVAAAAGSDGTLSDELIAQLLQQHFSIPPSAYLTAVQQPPSNSSSSKASASSSSSKLSKARASTGLGNGTKAGSAKSYESVDTFVSEMSKLLELEKQAEVEAAQEATSLCSTEAAQVGNARCQTVDITLQSASRSW